MKLNIALEWFLNPDHLPFIAGVALGKYKEAGVDVNIIEPTDHYDGFDALNEGTIDIHVNEPLHLFEHYFDGIKSLGCFFETRGGVMIRQDRVEKLHNGQKIKITTPASNEITNKIGFEIIKRYGEKNNITIKRENVEFVQMDFYHIKNMQENIDFDGAWLCFYNFEGIEAELAGFDNLFIDQSQANYPNFSALELMSTKEIIESKKEAIEKFVKITGEMATYLKSHPLETKTIYYDYTKTEKSKLMENIIEDTLGRFEENIVSNKDRWRELYHFLEELELVKLTENEYTKIW